MKTVTAILLILVVIVVLAIVVGYVLRGVARRAAERRAERSPWNLDEESDGELLTLYAVKPGEERLMIGAVAFAASDFDFKVEELRATGDAKLAALNSGRILRQ